MDGQATHAEIFRTRAYAKVNLALGVGRGEGSDGLHRICSWMHSIELCDEIEISVLAPGQESEYSIGWAQSIGADQPVEWTIEQDLGVRAHKVVEEHMGKQLPVRIRISKSIPAGGGLGGGSADASGVLRGLNELFGLGLEQHTLVELAMKLGSDIPFFLDGDRAMPRPAIVEGFGDQITRNASDHTGVALTLIVPKFGCHTGKVYGVFDELVEGTHELGSDRIRSLTTLDSIDASMLFNDLTSAAYSVAPELGVQYPPAPR